MAVYIPSGKYYEDINLDDKFCSPTRTMTETDIVNFAGLSSDYVQLHTSEKFAHNTQFGGRIAHGALTLSISTGQLTQTGILDGTVVAVVNINVDYKGVVRIGDDIHTEITVAELKPTKNPKTGVVKLSCDVYNHEDALVVHYLATCIMLRKN